MVTIMVTIIHIHMEQQNGPMELRMMVELGQPQPELRMELELCMVVELYMM